MVLERYADLLDIQEKGKGKEGYVAKTNPELEKEARTKCNEVFHGLKILCSLVLLARKFADVVVKACLRMAQFN